MRETRREEKAFGGWGRMRFSARRREEERTEGLAVEIAVSRV